MIMNKLFIPVVLGTAREGRASEVPARFVFEELKKQEGVETEFVDVRDHVTSPVTIPPWGVGGANEKATPWKEIATRADAFILVMPEYNHGYPGELKQLLDSLYKEYEKKPVAICGVSAGGLGGARVVEHIKQVLVEFKMVPMKNSLYFSNIKNLFDEKDVITDESYKERAKQMFTDLIWYAKALKEKRMSSA